MTLLPEDAYHQIFTYLPGSTLANCRLLDRRVGAIATQYVFRHIRLEAANDAYTFVNVTTSPALRLLVREVTVDTWVGPDFKYHVNGRFRPPRDFFRALAYLRFLPGLKTLNVRFNKFCGVDGRDGKQIEETYDLRYLVLDILFRSISGKWPQASQPLLEASFVDFDPDDEGTLRPIPTEETLLHYNELQGAIDIRTLTISNLADFDDERLTRSDAFKKVMSSKSLTSLKLFATTELNSAAPELSIGYLEKYDFFQTLPETWLSPPVAQNLRVLSLFFQDYWGWFPKMDFRAVNPGKGESFGLPNLRVLALGNYVISHEWQVEWIASSIGHHNGRGGLEELYLDDCPIMWQAHILQPLDESTTVYSLSDGDTIKCSNSGYPIRDVAVDMNAVWDPAKFAYPLRWSYVLDHWRRNMTALKVFKMGHGAWGADALNFRMLTGFENPVPFHAKRGDLNWAQEISRVKKENEHRKQRIRDTVHLDYDCPSPPSEHIYEFAYNPKYIHGVGLEHEREQILQYVHFDILLAPTPWIERDNARDMIHDEGLEAYTAARAKDEDAYETLMGIAQRRAETKAPKH